MTDPFPDDPPGDPFRKDSRGDPFRKDFLGDPFRKASQGDPFRIDGRRALVAGASTGIGQAIALGLARAGAYLIAAGRSSAAGTVARIEAAGGAAEAMGGRPVRAPSSMSRESGHRFCAPRTCGIERP